MGFRGEHRICRKAYPQTSEERFVQNLSEGEIKLQITLLLERCLRALLIIVRHVSDSHWKNSYNFVRRVLSPPSSTLGTRLKSILRRNTTKIPSGRWLSLIGYSIAR